MSSNVIELQQDIDELNSLISQATRQTVKKLLLAAHVQLENDLKRVKATEAPKPATSEGIKKRCVVELNEYAWDESDKYVKIFVTLDGSQKLVESDVVIEFTENSFKLLVKNLNDKDHSLTINNLLHPIDVDKSYHKIKSDMIVIYIKKKKEGEKWSFLTVTEKRLKDAKDSEFKMDDMDDDPSSGLMKMMKKMYDSGDANMKRSIAKAWTESQQKQKELGMEF